MYMYLYILNLCLQDGNGVAVNSWLAESICPINLESVCNIATILSCPFLVHSLSWIRAPNFDFKFVLLRWKIEGCKSYFSEFFNLLLSSSLQAGTITLKSTVGSSSILGNSRFFKIFGSRYVFSCLCRFITGNGVVKDFCIITSCNDVVSTKNVGHYL